ncbi:protein kinase [Actinoplanes sp. Pm04-4]|uniref:non-specific serine/threonine protein kinase n=1 Tax=Paractinoplanes pyxinae TaxID=2997416 RepID=A0ABT4BEP5_9ACTN|nr:serine/threonine protein kinase [Actinoplanes pyxinae]MCY1144996.1 protein kinase [Actinoplanes pyxinae]
MDGSISAAGPGTDLAGRVLGGRYELLVPIGTGGMAVVWRGRDHVLAREVAVKIVATAAADHRIRQEAQAAAALSHPNIAQVHDYGEFRTNGGLFPYVVMELVEGGTLAQRLASGPVSPPLAMRVCAEVAAALAAAHSAGLVHRDIKPANVMLGPTGAKVVDFGIAAVTAPSGTGDLDPELLGTPAYLAPERLIDDAVEPASDVYALGVVLYRLLSGHSPWTTEDTTQMLKNHIYVEPAPLPAVPGVPGHVRDLCERCLRKDPSGRPSAREAATLLSAGAEPTVPAPARNAGQAAHTPADAPARIVRARGRTPAGNAAPARRPALVAATVAAMVAVGAAGWMLAPGDKRTAGSPSATPSPAPPPSGRASVTASVRPADAAPSARRSAGPIAAATPANRPATTSAAPADTATPTGTTTTPVTATVTPPGAPTAAPTVTTVAPPPATRSFSSTAGTLTATCPSPSTAEILSYSPSKTFKVQSADPGPGPAATVTFKHGKATTTMTVTCDAGRPAASTT